MTLVADATHPATVSWRYRNGSVVREEYASAVTPVTLAEADGFETVFESEDGNSAYAVAEGALWTVAMVAPGWHLPQDDLVDWLRGDKVSGGVTSEMEALLARSPLCRAPVPYAPGTRGTQCRGESAALPGNALVVGADVDGAGLAVQAWLDRNVRVCSGSFLVRSPGPHLSLQGGALVARHAARSLSAWAFAARGDRAAEAWDWAASRGLVPAGPPALPDGHAMWAHLPAMADPEDSDVMLANAAVAWTARALARNFPAPGGGAHDRPRVAVQRALGNARDAVMPYADLASLGLVTATDAKEAVRACVSALADLVAFERDLDVPHPPLSRDVMLSSGGMAHAAEVRMSYLAGVVLPAFADVPEPDGDDADALGGLTP